MEQTLVKLQLRKPAMFANYVLILKTSHWLNQMRMDCVQLIRSWCEQQLVNAYQFFAVKTQVNIVSINNILLLPLTMKKFSHQPILI